VTIMFWKNPVNTRFGFHTEIAESTEYVLLIVKLCGPGDLCVRFLKLNPKA